MLEVALMVPRVDDSDDLSITTYILNDTKWEAAYPGELIKAE